MSIKPKEKKCKGVNDAKGFGCGKLNTTRKYGLGLECRCYQNWLFSDAGKEKLEKAQIRGIKKAKKVIKKENIKRKLESKSIASLIQETKKPFQKLIRIRDHGKRCICCDNPLPFNISEYDGGHFLKAEIYTGLIFHPHNVNGQRTYCNKYAHGNESDYSEGLKQRIGIDDYNKLISSKNALKSYKWDRYKLIELKDYYNKELKLVEKGLKDIKDVDLTVGIVNND